MVIEPDYRDSVKKLKIKISVIAQQEMKGNNTVKRELLCKILNIPIRDKVNTEQEIHETLVPICLKNQLNFGDVRHKMLCDYFGIPVYYIPKKKRYLEYRALKLLINVYPQKLSSSEIANTLDEDMKQVNNMLHYYSRHNNTWFEKSLGKRGKRTVCLWTASPLGIEAYHSGEAKLLQKRIHVSSIKPKPSRKPEIRKTTPKAVKILNVLASADFPLPSRAIADATDMDITHVCDTLKNDHYSISPFFEKLKCDGCYRYQASKIGINYYYKQMRGVESGF